MILSSGTFFNASGRVGLLSIKLPFGGLLSRKYVCNVLYRDIFPVMYPGAANAGL
jgi:hypothetical protein